MATTLSDLIYKLQEIQKLVPEDVPIYARDPNIEFDFEITDVGAEIGVEDDPSSYYVVFDMVEG